MEQENRQNSYSLTSKKGLIIFFSIFFILLLANSIISFIKPVNITGITSICTAVSFLIGILYLIISSKSKQSNQIRTEEIKKKELLDSLKLKLSDSYPDIDKIDASYILLKIENIKQEIKNKLQNHIEQNEQVKKIDTEYSYNTDKLINTNRKIEENLSISDEIDSKINLIIKENTNFSVTPEAYSEVIDIIKNLKDYISERNSLLQEIEDTNKEKELIVKELNSFIIDNDITISLSEKYADNISKLRIYNDENTENKQKLDIIRIEIENLKTQIKIKEEKKEKLNCSEVSETNNDIDLEINNLRLQKDEKMKQKQEAEFQKRELETFEGLENLKLERNLLQDEYNDKIKELIKNKIIISLIETAKNSFDKVQPDLQNAQKYLSILTDGKYSEINLDLEEIQNREKTITKKWNELSRGTKEQLYLALRLGYASNYSKDKVTLEPNGRYDLPLIIDDAFVNFDSLRTQNAVKCLIEFSKHNQVLFFTCHGEIMKKYFEAVINISDLNIVNM